MPWAEVPTAAGFRGQPLGDVVGYDVPYLGYRPSTWELAERPFTRFSPDICNLRRQTLRSSGARWGPVSQAGADLEPRAGYLEERNGSSVRLDTHRVGATSV